MHTHALTLLDSIFSHDFLLYCPFSLALSFSLSLSSFSFLFMYRERLVILMTCIWPEPYGLHGVLA